MITWVVQGNLAQSARPGYAVNSTDTVSKLVVAKWLENAWDLGVRSIICLMDQAQLSLYNKVPEGLLGYYKDWGFSVEYVPVKQGRTPPLSSAECNRIYNAFASLPKPVLIQCGDGSLCTEMALHYIAKRLEANEAA